MSYNDQKKPKNWKTVTRNRRENAKRGKFFQMFISLDRKWYLIVANSDDECKIDFILHFNSPSSSSSSTSDSDSSTSSSDSSSSSSSSTSSSSSSSSSSNDDSSKKHAKKSKQKRKTNRKHELKKKSSKRRRRTNHPHRALIELKTTISIANLLILFYLGLQAVFCSIFWKKSFSFIYK